MLTLLALCLFLPQDEPAGAEPRFELEVYGETTYSFFDYGPNQRATPQGAEDDTRGEFDIPRVVTEFKYRLNDDYAFKMEIEYEHGGTGSALELEYEEFGEYETEVEKGGEVILEQFHFVRSWGPDKKLKVGRIIVPFGSMYNRHNPLQYWTNSRPEEETSLLPSTWHEMGVSFEFPLFDGKATFALVNGLDSSGFDSKFWIRNGHQQKFETVNATDLAISGRYERDFGENLNLGASGYFGNTIENRPKDDLDGVEAYLAMGSVHGRWKLGRWQFRGFGMYGDLQNAFLITQKNSRLSTGRQSARTPVADNALAWFLEAGYDVWRDVEKDKTLTVFAHAGQVDSMASTHAGIFAVPRFDRRLAVLGFNYHPIDELVVKFQVTNRSFLHNTIRDENAVQVALGYAGTLFSH